MNPVDQTRFAEDGNCFAAALASVLEIPLEEVPEFTEDGWLIEVNTWLQGRGLCYLEFPVHEQERWRTYYLKHAGFHLLLGDNRGLCHAVVAKAGVIVHDPHPSQDGLSKVTHAGFLIPLSAAAWLLEVVA